MKNKELDLLIAIFGEEEVKRFVFEYLPVFYPDDGDTPNQIYVNPKSELLKLAPQFCFYNYRQWTNNKFCLRLNKYGIHWFGENFETYKYKLKEPLTGALLIKLEECMRYPYYVAQDQIVFTDMNSSAFYSMNGYDMDQFLDTIK